ncbi:hypothetical protein [Mycolicibacterium sp. XJ1819]
MSKRVTVEYTKDVDAYPRHKDDTDKVVVSKGTRRQVDPRSAKKLVDSGRAKVVGAADERADAREAMKATEQPAGGGAG